MNAELFYSTQADRAIPLYLLSLKQWEEGSAAFSSLERNAFALSEFKGKIGDYCLINNTKYFGV